METRNKGLGHLTEVAKSRDDLAFKEGSGDLRFSQAWSTTEVPEIAPRFRAHRIGRALQWAAVALWCLIIGSLNTLPPVPPANAGAWRQRDRVS